MQKGMSAAEYARQMEARRGLLESLVRAEERMVRYGRQFSEWRRTMDAERYIWWATVGSVLGKRARQTQDAQ